ncbi:resistance protein [Musa troglodytarum]|uniref:Resistance protein n=1 Tax=Musa troglodytarum TaxID=320322 RepID=A0A9E7G5G4_9LILI|nr:resistance protein [Musa troglodytarum]
MAGVDLRHVLLDLLPSSDMTERCRELRIHHHLEKIIPDLWAINAVIWDATMRAGAQPDVEMWMADEGAVIRDATIRAGTQPDVEMWMADAGAAIADVQNLLDRILEWPGRAAAPSNPLLRSCLGIRVAFRLSILQELKEMGRRSKELVRRGSALDLRKEAMDAMDPCDEEYSNVLGEEVVGRDKDRDNIVEILQQNQSSSNGEPFVIAIRDEGRWSGSGKTTVARMIYHHPWVRQHFHHRIWVDVSMDLYSDPVSIGREFARCITGESCDHLRSHQAMWLLVNERLGQRRYLLILNDVYYSDRGMKDKWDQLVHNLLRVGGMGSTVIITTKRGSRFSRPLDIHGCRDYLLAGLSEDAWIELFMRDTLIGSAQDKATTCSINFLLQFAKQYYETLEGKTMKGSPLLAKTLGSIFRYTEGRRWQQLADALSSHSGAWIQQLPHTIGKLVCLRYLNLSYTEIQALPKNLSHLQNLKILKLAHCEEFRKLPESIHKLKKLLILKLAYCQKLQMLPESITALTNLQELDVEGCQWLMKLPEGLDNMKNLTMLNVDKCVSLTRLPHGIGQLSNLQKLSVHVTVDNLASVILELQSLANLKELCLKKLDELPSAEDARALKLKDKMFLKRLALCWEWWDVEVALATNAALLQHEQVLEDLQPTLALINLEIVSYMGKKLPSWMTRRQGYLKHLRKIKLVNLRKCERLSPLGQLLGLETIEISGMDSITTVDDAFYGDSDSDDEVTHFLRNAGGTFPRLKSLIFSEMPMLERWVKAKGEGDMFPRLARLMLIQCPKFKELHVRPSATSWSLFTLSLWLNNDKLLSSEFVGWQNLERVDALEITGCEELRTDPTRLRQAVIHSREAQTIAPYLQEDRRLSEVAALAGKAAYGPPSLFFFFFFIDLHPSPSPVLFLLSKTETRLAELFGRSESVVWIRTNPIIPRSPCLPRHPTRRGASLGAATPPAQILRNWIGGRRPLAAVVARYGGGGGYRPGPSRRRPRDGRAAADPDYDPALDLDRIKSPSVRLLGEQQNMLGVVSIDEAVRMADDADLILMQTLLCFLFESTDYKKHKFEQQKKKASATKRSAANMSEDRYNIDSHDYSVRLKAARKFLKDGDKVKVIVNLKGRENEFRNIAIELLQRFQSDIGERNVVNIVYSY